MQNTFSNRPELSCDPNRNGLTIDLKERNAAEISLFDEFFISFILKVALLYNVHTMMVLCISPVCNFQMSIIIAVAGRSSSNNPTIDSMHFIALNISFFTSLEGILHHKFHCNI